MASSTSGTNDSVHTRSTSVTDERIHIDYISTKDNRLTSWFSIDDENFEAFFKIVTAIRFMNDMDIGQLCKVSPYGETRIISLYEVTVPIEVA